jgi:hypothetical protein
MCGWPYAAPTGRRSSTLISNTFRRGKARERENGVHAEDASGAAAIARNERREMLLTIPFRAR